MTHSASFSTALVFAGCLLLAGCGDNTMGTVSGTVSFDGTPLKTGAIQFVPVDGNTATAGAVITNGTYSAQVPVGQKTVIINGAKVVGKKKLYDAPQSPTMDVVEELLPAKYNTKTTLTLDVKPGANPNDFTLDSK
jgi:hypothetical protein